MTLIRIGKRGINLAHVVCWISREEDNGKGHKHLIVEIEYVNRESDTFTHDEAVALWNELERRSSDILESFRPS